MPKVLTHVRNAYGEIGSKSEAHAKLIEWGAAIQVQFNIDNLHLKDRLSASPERLRSPSRSSQAIKGLASTVAGMNARWHCAGPALYRTHMGPCGK